MPEDDLGPAVAQLVADLGSLTLALEQVQKRATLPNNPAILDADAAVIRAAELMAMVLFSKAPERALGAAREAVEEASRRVKAAEGTTKGGGDCGRRLTTSSLTR
jgi:hypothetical protein